MHLRSSLILVPLALTLLGGCAATRQTISRQGYVADAELSAAVAPGVDNQQSVARMLGQPTLISEWDKNIWYYVSRDTKQLAFSRPRPVSEEVLMVRFDDAGNVAAVERRGLDKVVNIRPVGAKTPTLGRDSSLFDDIFGNIGSVSAGGGQ